MTAQDRRHNVKQYTTSTTASSELPLSSSPMDSATEEHCNRTIANHKINGDQIFK